MRTFKILRDRTTAFLIVLLFGIIFYSCNDATTTKEEDKTDETIDVEANNKVNDQVFTQVMQKHLDAVSNRDLKALGETMAPNGQMQLILPGTEIIDGVDGFMEYHREWFAAPDWTFETKILNTEVGQDVGMAITEIVYREPMRDGKPYFNRMIVSYDLKKIDGNWFIIKDHACSIEKSTDVK